MQTRFEYNRGLPNRFITGRWLAILFLFAGFFMSLAHTTYRRRGIPGLLYALVLPLYTLLVIGMEALLRLAELKKQNRLDDEQLQALIGLYVSLHPRAPLPQTRRWAASPDMLLFYSRQILKRKPEVIVELGSGVSSVVAGYCTQKNKRGKAIVLDHEKFWADNTRDYLVEHGLEKEVEVRHAPLKTVNAEGGIYQWYDPEALKDIERIDLLFIDGPPDSLDEEIRMPAFYVLGERLSEDGVIILDDAYRLTYRTRATDWARTHGFIAEWHPFEKGAILMRRRKPRSKD